MRHFLDRKHPASDKMPKLEWKALVERMHDQGLEAFVGEVTVVIYSKDRAMRYVVVKDKNGLFRYWLEELYLFDEEEWHYVRSDPDALPAMWTSHPDANQHSIFDTQEHALRELYSEPFYKNHFI